MDYFIRLYIKTFAIFNIIIIKFLVGIIVIALPFNYKKASFKGSAVDSVKKLLEKIKKIYCKIIILVLNKKLR